MKRENRQILGIMAAYSLAALAAAALTWDASDSLAGFLRILTHPAQLTVDYFRLGTVGGAFLNAGLGIAAVFGLSGTALGGVSLMAFFLVFGYCFFGMNLYNIWPCVFGGWLFARAARERFADHVHAAVFSAGLAPFVSEIAWRYPAFAGLPLAPRLALALLIGAAAGFLMPPLCRHSPSLHRGYTLYNAAPAAGFISVALFACLYRAAGVEIPANTALGDSLPRVVNGFALSTSAAAALAGLATSRRRIRDYGKLLTGTGYGRDLFRDAGAPLALVNIGVFGLFMTAWYNITGAPMTGPTLGCILCLLAVAGCGGTCLNVLPILLGYALAAALCAFEINAQAMVVGLCFAAALCFGAVSGVAVGLLHACTVTTVATFHGGMCLFNGGFTSGIAAILAAPVLEYFFEPRDRMGLLPRRKKH